MSLPRLTSACLLRGRGRREQVLGHSVTVFGWGSRRCATFTPRVADVESLAFVREKVEDASSSALAASAPRKSSTHQNTQSDIADTDLIPATELRAALVAARNLPARGNEASRMRRLLAQSFEAAVAELLDRGECVAIALQLPLSEGAEQPLKRFLMKLGRRLRQADGFPASELPGMPALMQRVGLKDEPLFEDFLGACAQSWSVLSPSELSQLLRSTEDYALLHVTEGTAITRLLAALENSLQTSHPPAACAALSQALLAVRSRSSCVPLLEQLRDVLVRASQVSASESLVVIEALADVHAAIGVPQDAMKVALDSVGSGMRSGSGVEISVANVASVMRACTRCYWVAPEAVESLFQASLQQIVAKDDNAHRDVALLRSCRHLPASLRSKLVESLLPAGEALAARVGELDGVAALEVWLLLVHDLPSFARASDDVDRHTAVASVAEVLLRSTLEKVDASESTPSALVVAFLAASSVANSYPAGAAGGESLAQLAASILDRLEGMWPAITASQIQMLFRTPGDVAELARQASAHIGSVQDLHAQIALLNALSQVSPATDLSAGREAILRRLKDGAVSVGGLCSAEAALRRGSGAQEMELLAAFREAAFRGTLRDQAAWNRRPARGYMRYVEECLQRSRKPSDLEHSAPRESLETEVAATAPEGLKSAIAAISHIEDVDETPRGDFRGVRWHPGMEGFEVKIEVGGHKVLGGYFQPHDDTEQEVERARQEAIACRLSLENKHGRRVATM